MTSTVERRSVHRDGGCRHGGCRHLLWALGFAWFGHLPGDIRIERENVRIYIPVISMLLVSVVATAGATHNLLNVLTASPCRGRLADIVACQFGVGVLACRPAVLVTAQVQPAGQFCGLGLG